MPDDWLKSLKAGDEVCYNRGSYAYCHYEITKVSKITPTGKIRTADGKSFNERGYWRSADSWKPGLQLEPVTDKIRDWLRRKELLYKIGWIKFDKLTTEQLEAIAEIAGVKE